jgi:hypothetical protein
MSEPGFAGLKDYQDFQKREDGKMRRQMTDDRRLMTDNIPLLALVFGEILFKCDWFLYIMKCDISDNSNNNH